MQRNQIVVTGSAPVAGLATIQQVRKDLLGNMSSSAFWRLRQRPEAKFPAAVKVVGSRPKYRVEEVLKWCKKLDSVEA